MQPTEEEHRSEGNIGLRMYVKYFKAGANFLVLLVLVLLNALAHVSLSSTIDLMTIFYQFWENGKHNWSIINLFSDVNISHFGEC